TERLSSPSIVRYDAGPSAEGVVENTAGVLTARGEIEAGMTCLCDRCGREFKRDKRIGFAVPIVPEGGREEPEALELEGEWLGLDDLLETVYILDVHTKDACREDGNGDGPGSGRD